MRITQNMIAGNSLKNLNRSYSTMANYLDKLSTGKKITKPSDDPVVAQKGMHYRTSLNEVEQYKRNLSELFLWMDNSEAAMDHANNNLQRVRDLVLQGNNDTNENLDKEAIAKEIGQLKKDLVSVVNTQVAGRYIFNGTDVNKPPVIEDGTKITVAANTKDYMVEASKGIQLKANVNTNQAFNQKLFDTLTAIEENLSGDESVGSLDDLLVDLDEQITNFSTERSDLGARYNRLELLESRIGNQEVLANKVLSDNEDADMEKVISDFLNQESVHRAALQVGAKVIQPSLLDFLR